MADHRRRRRALLEGDRHTRTVLLGSVVVVFSMLPHLAGAGPKVIQVEPSGNSEQPPAATAAFQEYRGFKFDRTQHAGAAEREAARLLQISRRRIRI
jgi:hypothetical protein